MPTVTLTSLNTTLSDTQIAANNPSGVYSGVTTLNIGVGANASAVSRVLLKFDLGLIPNNAIINSAVLTTTQQTTPSGTSTINIHPITGAWDDSVTWNTYPTFDSNTTVAYSMGNGPTYSVDIKTIVQSWVNGTLANNGILLKDSDEGTLNRVRTIYAKEYSTQAFHPAIAIDYTIPTTGKKQVEYVGTRTTITGANTSHTQQLPTGIQAGDFLVAHISKSGQANSISTPAGWTAAAEDAAGSWMVNTFFKFASASEPNPVFTATVGANWLGTVQAFRNVKAMENTSRFSYTSATTSMTAPSLTASVDGALAVLLTQIGNNGPTTPPLNFTEATDTTDSNGQGVATSYSYMHKNRNLANQTTTVSPQTSGVARSMILIPTINTAPNTPPTNSPKGSSTTPATVNTSTPILDWSFSDPDAGNTQSAYQVRVYNDVGTIIHNTGKVTSSLTDYQVPSGVIAQNATYSWTVQTWDQDDAASSESSKEYFRLVPDGSLFAYVEPGSTNQATPDGANLAPLVTWDYARTFTQTRYKVQIFDGVTNVLDTGFVTSAAKQYQVANNLLTAGKTYGLDLTVTEQATSTISRTTPTTVVGSAYTTSASARPQRLSNGWLVAVASTSGSTNIAYFIVSKDNGSSWQALTNISEVGGSTSIVSNGTIIHCIYANPLSPYDKLYYVKFDATTVPNSDRMSTRVNVDTGQTGIPSYSLAINAAGTELYAAFSTKNATYPNSFNIRYAKATLDGSGNAAWGSVSQITNSNTTGQDFKNPSCVVKNDKPFIFAESYYNSGSGAMYRIHCFTTNYTTQDFAFGGIAPSWGNKTIVSDASYAQGNPDAVVAPNGRIWTTWQGMDSTDTGVNNLRVAYSDDGASWTVMPKLTSGNTHQQTNPSITSDKNNNVYILWSGVDAAVAAGLTNLRKIKYDGSSWGAISTLTANTTSAAQYPATVSNYTDFTDPLVVFKDLQASTVKFRGVWTDTTTTDYPASRVYFATNNTAAAPIPTSPYNNKRTPVRPVFEAMINDDIENDGQRFVLQVAEDKAFTTNLQTFNSDDVTGWEVKKPGGAFGPITNQGVDSSYEGGTVRYTMQTDLPEGKTHYWRIASKGAASSLVNLMGTDGNAENVNLLAYTGGTAALDSTRKVQGTNSIKVTKNTGISTVDPLSSKYIYPAVGDYYVAIAEVYLENAAANHYMHSFVSGVTRISKYVTSTAAGYNTTTTGQFVPIITAFQVTVVTTPGTSNFYPRVYHSGTSGHIFNVDSFRIYKITQAEYDALGTNVDLTTAQSIAAQYPYTEPTSNAQGAWSNTFTNLLGTDGNCEDTSKLAYSGGTAALDATRKVQGSNSIKLTKTSGTTTASPLAAKYIYPNTGEYYVAIADAHLENEGTSLYIENSLSGVTRTPKYVTTVGGGYSRTTTGQFMPIIVAYKIDTVTTPGTSYIQPKLWHVGASGDSFNVDSFRVYKITKQEYDALGESVDLTTARKIAAQYPYVDNTAWAETKIRVGDTLDVTFPKAAIDTKTAAAKRIIFSGADLVKMGGESLVPWVRVEETNPAAVYNTAWTDNAVTVASGGFTRVRSVAGSYVEFTFTGTAVRWIGAKASNIGIAEVYVDGVLQTTVDGYSLSSQHQQVMYEKKGLPSGQHKLKITVTSQKNPSASNTYQYIDAFEYITEPTIKVYATNNAFDASPTWEDATAAFLADDYHTFTNTTKTAANWGVAARVVVSANDALGEISIDGIAFNYD